ncbi:restriction endonuclease [Alkaliphilus transvaalensis]|uniref:restriction endonuclease n=1 Tax=Alkaliphilus transvaalensis TaxID=114628 RepID=UPI00047EF9C1|nr:restriction endonuclease [Alkaliphilus transvaalensis]
MSKTNLLFQFFINQIRGYKENRGESRRFRSYYMSNKEDTRGDAAKILDFIISRMVAFFLIFIITFMQTSRITIAITITVVAVTIYHLITIRIRNKKLETLKNQKRRLIASQKIYQEIMNNTVEELRNYITEIFDKAGFSNLSHQWNNHNTITIAGNYNNEKLLISTFIYKSELYVELKDLKEFIGELITEGCKKGILLTTSDFTKDCYQYIREIEEKYKILLLNKELMMNLIEKNNMFPTEEEIDELVENKISRREAVWGKYKKSLLANKKSRSYFILSLFLIGTAYYTPYPVYYMVVASITLFLTLMIITMGLFNRRDNEEEAWENLNKKLKEL